jgi:hypothetical protein
MDQWREHLREDHRILLNNTQLEVAASMAEQRKPQPVETLKCPLCLCVLSKSRRHFARHVGKHMESIALAALPRGNDSTSDSELAALTDSDEASVHSGVDTTRDDHSQASRKDKPRDTVFRTLAIILKEMQSHPSAKPFLQPVSRFMLPKYYDVISEPMDLATMEGKLNAGEYKIPGIIHI